MQLIILVVNPHKHIFWSKLHGLVNNVRHHGIIALTHIFLSQDNCAEVILSTDVPFRRLDHYKIHEYTKKWNMSQKGHEPVSMTMTTNIDTMFKRKRGRPPKNRVIEVSIYFNLCVRKRFIVTFLGVKLPYFQQNCLQKVFKGNNRRPYIHT